MNEEPIGEVVGEDKDFDNEAYIESRKKSKEEDEALSKKGGIK